MGACSQLLADAPEVSLLEVGWSLEDDWSVELAWSLAVD
jgi:hypothetical protein